MLIERKILVTSALPYANGHLHLGHLVEHIQTDIWVRTHKMLGLNCLSICGEDAHGTPIMLKAEAQGIEPEALIAAVKASHEQDFKAFRIDYDCYHSTHSAENQYFVEKIYQALLANGDIMEKTITQAFDPVKLMFLPDRYVKGTCPRCKAPDQYGDNCEACGATYSPGDLLDAVSVISGCKPVEKESVHYFFNLPDYDSRLKAWIHQGVLQEEVANKLDEWFLAGLKCWDISRDGPYFGFPIPGVADKFFYVWLDAPMGYMATFKKYCDEKGLDFDEYWQAGSTTELYHFVGKDIVYFHALFWPAVLTSANYRLPSAIFAHGFLTVNGQKMSKSRGTFIEARHYLQHLDPEYLRYYFAAKLNGKVEDLDLSFEDFTNRINADLVGKVVNIASRSAAFIAKYFNNHLADTLSDPTLYHAILKSREPVIEAFIARDYAQALRLIMENADKVNQYIDREKPWVLAKEEANLPRVQEICTMAINLFYILMSWLKPVLPAMAEKVELFLQIPPLTFASPDKPLLNKDIGKFEALMVRVDKNKIEALLNEYKA